MLLFYSQYKRVLITIPERKGIRIEGYRACRDNYEAHLNSPTMRNHQIGEKRDFKRYSYLHYVELQ